MTESKVAAAAGAKELPLMMSKKRSVKKKLAKEDRFRVNRDFRNRLKRIQVNALQKKETRKDSDQVHDKVLGDRRHYIDAAAVKTMKSRQKLKHHELIAEVMRLTRFPCEADSIEARIKHLIETQYMRPDDKDPKLYYYVA